ncbi:hypothetical protein F6J84_12690 [Microbacterium caowuchunii]|uniref:permease prefix domain 1-containing protein n=1 Tax=Microbacterium caowuchunii TaxID=2614638 RepID=UPI001248EAF6|nr:permease prefix domain 1-containing protein [Microbacterium caowuchunii]QEW00876.1 hypothetical protein F6J84_12690 [Microbacterium caowuchunii]
MTGKSSLTERYVAAATRTIAPRQRDDIAAELRASIDDQIGALVETGASADVAERTVLTELGDPDRLAADYRESPTWLIGPSVYFEWRKLLKLLMWIVVPVAAFGVALGQTLAGATIGEVIGSTVVAMIGVIVHLGFWVTLVFAILEHSGAQDAVAQTPWTPERLPEPSGTVFADTVASLVLLALGAGAVIWDRLIGFAPSHYPGLSILDPDLWPWWIAGLFVVMAAGAVLAIVNLRVGGWTVPTATANALMQVLLAVAAIWLLTQDRLINPDLWPTLITDGYAGEVASVMDTITGFVIAGVAIWSIIDGFLKARRR